MTITGGEEEWEDMEEEEAEIGAEGDEQNGTMSIVLNYVTFNCGITFYCFRKAMGVCCIYSKLLSCLVSNKFLKRYGVNMLNTIDTTLYRYCNSVLLLSTTMEISTAKLELKSLRGTVFSQIKAIPK